jgi:hypothetical protein
LDVFSTFFGFIVSLFGKSWFVGRRNDGNLSTRIVVDFFSCHEFMISVFFFGKDINKYVNNRNKFSNMLFLFQIQTRNGNSV